MHSFICLFKAEYYKTVRFKAIWFLFLFAFLLLALQMVRIYGLSAEEFNRLFIQSKMDSKPLFIIDYLFIFISLIFSFVVILHVALMKYLEDYSNGWRLLYTQPHSILKIHLSKIAVSVLFVLSILLSYIVIVIGFIELLNFTRPELNLFKVNSNYFVTTLHLIAYYFFHSVVILMLFYLASLVIKKFTLFIVFSIIFPFISLMILSDYLNPFIHFLYGLAVSVKDTRTVRMSNFNFPFLTFELIGFLYILFSFLLISYFSKRRL